jgi:hypothetical protein
MKCDGSVTFFCATVLSLTIVTAVASAQTPSPTAAAPVAISADKQLALYNSSFNKAELLQARRSLDRALAIDPNYARAHAALSRYPLPRLTQNPLRHPTTGWLSVSSGSRMVMCLCLSFAQVVKVFIEAPQALSPCGASLFSAFPGVRPNVGDLSNALFSTGRLSFPQIISGHTDGANRTRLVC